MADLQSYIQALYPDRGTPDEPQLMTPESAVARRTGRTQSEVDAAFPMAVRLMSAAQQHMVPPMGGGAAPAARGMRRFSPATRRSGQTIKDAMTGYDVNAGEMLGPERLRMLAQHEQKHSDDWQALASGTQGVVMRPPDHIL